MYFYTIVREKERAGEREERAREKVDFNTY